MTAKNTVRAAALLALVAAAPASAESQLKRGTYLVQILECGDCHTPGHFLGKPGLAHKLSGSDAGFQVLGLGYF